MLGTGEASYLHHPDYTAMRWHPRPSQSHALMLAKDGFKAWPSGADPSVDPGIDKAVRVVPVSPKMNSPV